MDLFLTRKSGIRNNNVVFLLFVLTLAAVSSVQAQALGERTPQSLVLPEFLTPIEFVLLLSNKNAEILISDINTKVNKELFKSESGLYEPIGFSSIKKEGRFRLNTVEEQIVSSNLPFLREHVYTSAAGVRDKLPTGADFSLAYDVESRTNNLIATQTSGLFHTEYTSGLILTLKQPLLRNAGRAVTETAKKLADLDFQISKKQFKQQLFKSTLDGLNLYWQVFKNQSLLQLRAASFAQTRELLNNADARLKAGKIPESAMLELRSLVLTRNIEFQRSQQSFLEAKLKLLSSLGSRNIAGLNLHLETDAVNPPLSPWKTPDTYIMPEDALKDSPLYAIAMLRKQQAEIRLGNLRNQSRPGLDFVMSGSGNGFAYKQGDAAKAAHGRGYPDWYIGFNLEVPLGGNYKASGQYAAQIQRLSESEIELDALNVSSGNDLLSAVEDTRISSLVMQESAQDVELQQAIYDNEVRRFNLGNTILSTVVQKNNALMEAKIRYIDNQIRFEQTKTLFYIYSGQFLAHYGIFMES